MNEGRKPGHQADIDYRNLECINHKDKGKAKQLSIQSVKDERSNHTSPSERMTMLRGTREKPSWIRELMKKIARRQKHDSKGNAGVCSRISMAVGVVEMM